VAAVADNSDLLPFSVYVLTAKAAKNFLRPPYKIKNDYQAVVSGISEGYKRFATGIRKTLQIELGGTCVNVGCVPKKAMCMPRRFVKPFIFTARTTVLIPPLINSAGTR